MLTDGFTPYLLAGSIIAVGLAGWQGYRKGHEHGELSVQAKWSEQKAKDLAKAQSLTAEYVKKQTQLNGEVETLREAYVNEIGNLTGTVDELLKQLRDAKARARGEVRSNPMPNTAAPVTDDSTGEGCTGTELRYTDQEFLVRQSERADRYRLLLAECRTVVEAFRQ